MGSWNRQPLCAWKQWAFLCSWPQCWMWSSSSQRVLFSDSQEGWRGKLLELHVLFNCFFLDLLLTQVIWFVKTTLVEVLWQPGWATRMTTRSKDIWSAKKYVTNFWLSAVIFGFGSWIGIILFGFPLMTLQPQTRLRPLLLLQMMLLTRFGDASWNWSPLFIAASGSVLITQIFHDILRCISTHSWSHWHTHTQRLAYSWRKICLCISWQLCTTNQMQDSGRCSTCASLFCLMQQEFT